MEGNQTATGDIGGISPAVFAEEQLVFDERMMPVRQDLVELLKKDKEFTHNAKILQRDRELLIAVCTDLLTGMSGRLIAKKHKISRNSVQAIATVMRQRRELEPLKKRVMGLLDSCIEVGLENYLDALLAGEIAPAQIPIPMAALIDKKGQLESGMVPGTERTVKEVTTEDVAAAWGTCIDVTSDVQSVSELTKPQQTGPIAAPDTGLDTSDQGDQGPEGRGGGSDSKQGGACAEGSDRGENSL